MNTIYDYVFGVTPGEQQQVCCCFHDDQKASAGISPEGQYNCFGCGVSATNDEVFIQKYFKVGPKRAQSIKLHLSNAYKAVYINNGINSEQRNYLNSIGINDDIINKYFIRTKNNKLLSIHKWNGTYLSATWFNSPQLSSYNAGAEKYKYDNVIGGICVPYDDVYKYKRLLICEGEKDCYTAKSMGFKSAVAKLGGANTPILPSIDYDNKEIIICYDCDEAGRQGAIKDAELLIDKCACKVKILNLGLQDKEDLNDYFIKYHHTAQDLGTLISNTPLYVPQPKQEKTKVETIIDLIKELNQNDMIEFAKELKIIIQNKLEEN